MYVEDSASKRNENTSELNRLTSQTGQLWSARSVKGRLIGARLLVYSFTLLIGCQSSAGAYASGPVDS